MRFFGLTTCDTCRKALAELRAAGHAPQVIDIRDPGLTAVELAALLATSGDQALNRASTTWRGLTPAEQAADSATLLARHPALIKRPVIERDGVWLQGWTPGVRAALGL